MSIAIYPALLFTVALLVTTAYFLMGGLPLLVLAHDTAVDARIVWGFFSLYYKAAFVTSMGAAVSFAALGRPGFALGAVAFSSTVVLLRKRLLPVMDPLGSQIHTGGSSALRKIRQIQSAALLVNLLQLMLLV